MTTEAQTHTNQTTTPLSIQQMKDAVQRFIDEALNKGDLDVVDETYSPDLVDHDKGHPHLGTGVEEGRTEVMLYRNAFPDIHQEIHEKIAEGNTVVHRWTSTGTHLGNFLGIPPTKRKMKIEGVTISRFGPDGKIVEIYNFHDRMAWMQQLGAKAWFWAIVKRSWTKE
jgi:steroid delta-isomerase-like uncharacterized protein